MSFIDDSIKRLREEEKERRKREQAAQLIRGPQSSSNSNSTNSSTSSQNSSQTSQGGSQSPSAVDKLFHSTARKYTNATANDNVTKNNRNVRSAYTNSSAREKANSKKSENEPSRVSDIGKWLGNEFMAGIASGNEAVGKSIIGNAENINKTTKVPFLDRLAGNLLPNGSWNVMKLAGELGSSKLAHDVDDYFSKENEKRQQNVAELRGDSGLREKVGNLTQVMSEQLPMLAYSLLSGGSGGAASGVSAYGKQVATSLVNPASLSTYGNYITRAVAQAGQNMSENPYFWDTFLKTFGPAYYKEKDEGANDAQALVSAATNSFAQSAIEIGGGFETAELKEGFLNKLKEVIKSSGEEGSEEIWQDIVDNLTHKALGSNKSYDEYNNLVTTPWFSTVRGKDAVINPANMIEQGAYGAVAGGLMTGTSFAGRETMNAIANSNYRNANPDLEERANELIQRASLQGREGEMATRAQNLAEEVSEQMSRGQQPTAYQMRELESAVATDEYYNDKAYQESSQERYNQAVNEGRANTVESTGTADEYYGFQRGLTETEQRNYDKAKAVMGEDASERSVVAVGRFMTGSESNSDIDTILLDPKAKSAVEELTDVTLPINNTKARAELENLALAHNIANNDRILEETHNEIRTNMSRRGGEFFDQNYDEAVATIDEPNAADIYESFFSRFYTAGTVEGADFEKTYNRIISPLVEDFGEELGTKISQVFDHDFAQKVFAEGQIAMNSVRAKAQGKRLSVKASENPAGFTYEEEARKHISDREANLFTKLAERMKVHIRLVSSIAGGQANGSYDPETGVILIAADSDNKFITVFKHELTHHLKNTSPELYQKLEDFVFKKWYDGDPEKMEERVQEYQRRYNMRPDQAREEIIADASEAFFTDEGAINEAVTFNEKMARAIHDGIKSLLDTFLDLVDTDRRADKGYGDFLKDLDILRDAEKMWLEALNESVGRSNGSAESGTFIDSSTGENVQFSLRTEAPPKKTRKGYKVFVVKNGELYPPMVANPNGEPTPVGVWLNADEGVRAGTSKTGRPQVKAGGKGTQGGSGTLAYRPGWHLGEMPLAQQFARKDSQGNKTLFPSNFVWAECDIAADNDYQEEAMSYGYTENGKFRHAYAGLPRIPKDGFYQYRTNPDPNTVPWLITGAMKINRILSDAEVRDILAEKGIEAPKRQGGDKTLEELGIKNVKLSLKDSDGNKLSEGQREYFKNSKARDENGNLLVMYHGTENAGFTIFDSEAGISSPAFFFTNNLEIAKGYSGTHDIARMPAFKSVEAVRKAIKRDMDADIEIRKEDGKYVMYEDGDYVDESRNLNDLYNLYNQYSGFGGTSANYKVYLNVTNPLIVDAKGKSWDDITTDFSDEPMTSNAIAEYAKENGYDGVIIRNVVDAGLYNSSGEYKTGTDVIAFNPEQIKDIDNKNPTKDPDIRFSMKTPVEETKDLLAVHNLKAEDLRGALDLGGFPMPSIAIIKAAAGHDMYGDFSAIFDKKSIDPKASSKNVIYGGDAWTPTFPRMQFKPNDKVAKRISEFYYENARRLGYDVMRPLQNLANEPEDALNREGGEAALIEGYKNNPQMMRMFLRVNDNDVETVVKRTETTLSDGEISLRNHFINAFGEDGINEFAHKDAARFERLNLKKEWVKEHKDEISEVYSAWLKENGFTEGQIKTVLDNMKLMDYMSLIQQTQNYIEGGATTVKEETDIEATNKAVEEKAKKQGYDKWVDDLLKGIEEKKGIRNNTEFFTRSGNRRSWEALHDEPTLVNIVNVMAAQDNGETIFGSSLKAVGQKRYKNISEVRADKGRLKTISEEEYKELMDSFAERENEIITRIDEASPTYEDNPFIRHDEIRSTIVDNVRKGMSKAAFLNDLKKWASTKGATAKDVDDIFDLVRDVANIPTGYFEAKPKRPVTFEEVKALLAPSDAPNDLISRLQDEGVNVVQYEAGNSEDRIAKLNQAAEKTGTKFSLKSNGESRSYQSTITKLENQVKDLKSEFKRTNLKTADQKQVRIQAGKLITRHGSNMQAQKSLIDTFNEIFRLYKEKGTDAFDEVYEIAKNEAVNIVNNISVVHNEGEETYKAIKDYLRNTPITISEDMKRNITDFNDFRKRYFGKLKITNGNTTNIDTVYMELMELFPEQFTEDYVNPADQLYHMADVLDNYAPYYETLDGASEEMQDYVVDIASDIMETAYGLQTKKTFADKKYLEKEAAVAKARADALASRDKALANQKKRYEEKLEFMKSHNKEMRDKARARQKVAEERAKEERREKREARRERKKDSEARTRLLEVARSISRIKSSEQFEAIKEALIGQLDLEAKSMTGKTKMKLEDLQKWYEDQVENNDWFVRNEKLEEKFKRLNKTHIADMGLEDVENLTEILLMLEHKIRNDKKLINSQYQHDVFRAAVETANGINESKGLKFFGLHKLDDVFVGQSLSPMRYIRRLTGYDEDNPLMIATRELQNGELKALDYRMKALKPFNRFADLKFVSYLNGKRAPQIEVNATTMDMKPTTVKIIPAIRIWFYLSSLNEDNMRHIVNGGVHIPDAKLLKAGKRTDAYDRGRLVRFSKSQVQAIINGMTTQEKAYADQVYNYFNNVAPKATNEVSEQLDGISIAKVKNYLRISVDKDFLDVDADIIKRDGTLEGMGSHKERTKSSKPVYAEDISDVLMRAIEADSKYVGMAIPIRNFNKIYHSSSMEAARGEAEHKQLTGTVDNSPVPTNGMPSVIGDEDSVSYRTLTGGYLSVQETIKKMWSSDATDYIDKFISDLQFAHQTAGVVEKGLRKLTSNYAAAVLTLNASVAIKQAASFPTAAAVVGWKPLIKSLGRLGKLDLDYVDSVTPLLNYRTEGFNFRETGDIQNRGNREGFFQRATRSKALNWIQGMDVLTTRKLFKAAQIYVEDNFKLKKGSEAYDKKVAEIYNKIITETQPNYTTMERPGHLRSDSTLERTLSMFKTQPYQNFNILYDATGNYLAKRAKFKDSRNEENRKALKEANKDLVNASTSQVVQLAVFAAMTSLWALFRRKDDKYRDENGNITFASYMKQIAKDMLSGAFSEIFLGSEVFRAIDSKVNGTYYRGFSSVTDSAINDIFNTMTDLIGLMGDAFDHFTKGEEAETTTKELLKQMEKVGTEMGRFTGIPTGNIRNLINATYNWVAVAADGEYIGSYEALKMSFAKDTEKKELLMKAYRNDSKAYEELRKMMIEDGFKEDSLDYYIRKQSRENPDESSQTRYQEMVTYLEGSPMLWTNNDSSYKEAYDKVLRDIALGIETSTTESYTKYEGIGLKPEELVLVKLAMEKADQMYGNKNGYLDTNEKEKGLDMLTHLHLTQKEKEAIKKIKFNFDKKG